MRISDLRFLVAWLLPLLAIATVLLTPAYTALFYADHLLTKAPGLRDSIVEGADSVTALALEAF